MTDRFDRSLLLKCIIALLFPAVVCLAYLAVRGIRIGDIFLPASINNDSSFYYKTVEGILDAGMPRGYFGYNESHAMVGRLGAWNPAIYLPWVLWGKVFGWGFYSPIICNIVLFSVSLFLFTFLTRPGKITFAAGLFTIALFPSFPIHVMSGLPETVLTAHFLLFLGVSARALDLLEELEDKSEKSNRIRLIICLLIAFLLVIFLALVRPFLITLMAIPIYIYVKVSGKRAAIISGIIFIITVVSYYLMNKYCTTEYLSPMFDTSMIEAALSGDIILAVKITGKAVLDTWSAMWELITGAFKYGSTAGTQYIMAFMGLLVALVLFLDRRQKTRKAYYAVFAISLIMIVGAILVLLQLAPEGARHLWMYAIAGCILWPKKTADKEGGKYAIYYALKGASVVLLLTFMIKGSLVPTDYDVPHASAEFKEYIATCQSEFAKIEVDTETDDPYRNTIDWVIWDYAGDEFFVTEYAPLYVLPEGMGISCCADYHMIDNIDSLKSRYVYTDKRGKISDLCISKNMKVVANVGNIVIYENVK